MRSSSCGFENPTGMNFCGRCGTTLSPRCTHCDFENPAGFAFCGKCGANLAEPPPARSLKRSPTSYGNVGRQDQARAELSTAIEPTAAWR
jgi:hypothetical protein